MSSMSGSRESGNSPVDFTVRGGEEGFRADGEEGRECRGGRRMLRLSSNDSPLRNHGEKSLIHGTG